MKNMTKHTQVTVRGTLSYAKIWEPDPETKKYSCALLVDKDDVDSLDKIAGALDAAIEAGKTKLANQKGNVVKATLKLPLRDGDDEHPGEKTYENKMFFNCSSKRKIPVVDRHRVAITDTEEVYSGCIVNAVINLYAFNTGGNKGIAVGINAIQKVRDGERLGGGSVDINKAFEDMGDDDDDDFLN